jgi:hypothetical protein
MTDADARKILCLTQPPDNSFTRLIIQYSQLDGVKAQLPGPPAPNPKLQMSSMPLDKLPLEVQCMILSRVDYLDLKHLKMVNHAAQALVYTIPEYVRTVTAAPEILPVLAFTKLESSFDLKTVHQLLVSSECAFCHRFGGFVFLPSLQRCCQYCVEYHPDTKPIARYMAHAYEIPGKALDKLPRMQGPSGYFGEPARPRTNPYDGHLLMSRGLTRQAGKNKMPGYVIEKRSGKSPDQWAKAWQRYMVVLPMPFLNVGTGEIHHGLQCKGCALSPECQEHRHTKGHRCQLRSLTGELIPSYPLGPNHGDQNARQALHANNIQTCGFRVMKTRLYTPEGFLRHFEECAYAQNLWQLTPGTTS